MAVKRAKTNATATAGRPASPKPKTTSRAKSASGPKPASGAKARAPAQPRPAAGRKTTAGAKKTAKTAARAPAGPPVRPTLLDVVLAALADMKAVDVRRLDVRALTDITDTMVVASGTSDRHVRSIVERVVQRCKEAGFRPFGVEGARDGEWVLLDLQDVVLHVMLPRVREFYGLEKLWGAAGAAA